MTQEVLKLALEALHKGKVACEWGQAHDHVQLIVQAMEAIKEALALPEQEPTNLERHERNVQKFLGTQQPKEPEQEPACCNGNCPNTKDCEQAMQCLYTTPPQRTWVGLTDEEIKPCWHEACQTDLELTSQLVVYFAKAIEAKLKEKNSAA